MELGDRMKMYEMAEAGRKATPLLPLCVRLDGRSFHSWTKDLERPHDEVFCALMQDATKMLVEETNARVGYTQSDEISLVLYSDNIESELFFDGKFHKINSVCASLASSYFNMWAKESMGLRPIATFDCRSWNVPNLEEAANAILWREEDATRNSVSMAARSMYSHQQVQNKKRSDLHEMMHQKGKNWNDYPDCFKRGSYFRRVTRSLPLTPEQLAKIPKANRPEPGTLYERSIVERVAMPPLSTVTNKVGCLFMGYSPLPIMPAGDKDAAKKLVP